MVLQFNPAPYVDPDKERADLWNNALISGSNAFAQGRQNSRQQQLQDLQMQILQQDQARKQAEDRRKSIETTGEYGTQAPSSMTTPITGPMTMDQSLRSVLDPGSPASPAPSGGMVDKFRSWQQSRRQGAAAPDTSGLPKAEVGRNEVLPGLFDANTERGLGWTGMMSPGTKGIESAGKLFEAKKKLQGEAPDSLEKLLAQRVQSGELTLEKALELKAKSSPSYIKPQPPPPGYRYKTDGSLEPIPGGPAFTKTQEEAQREKATRDAQSAEAQNVISKIDSALSKVNGLSAGAMAGTSHIPGIGQITGATDLSADLDSIISNLGLGKLMEMKQNSKAGASGMGALSDKEMNLLTSSIASLKQSQSPAQLRQHLNDVKTHYQNIMKMSEGVNPFDQGGGGGFTHTATNPKTGQKMGFNGKEWVALP